MSLVFNMVGGGGTEKEESPCIVPAYISVGDPVNYTYRPGFPGTFLVAFVRGDSGGSISSTGTIATLSAASSFRQLGVYLVTCNNSNDSITVSVNNYSGGAYRGNNVFIGLVTHPIEYKNDLIKVNKIDGTVTANATFESGTKYLLIQMSCGSNRSSSRTINDPKLLSGYSTDSMYIAIVYGQGSSASFSQHGNTAGGAWIYACALK